MKKRGWSLGLLIPAFLAVTGPVAGAADEPPPAQGTVLHFRKSLHIQPTAKGRVFSETHRVVEGDTLGGILSREYQIPVEAQGALKDAFRAVNPGVDPAHLPVGRIVRIPFKLEETLRFSGPEEAGLPQTHTVRRGESLWRILRKRYKVPKRAMAAALAAIARANPEIRNLDHIVPGQKISIPTEVSHATPAQPQGVPPSTVTVVSLLRELHCQVYDRGETLIRLARGHSVRLDGRDFPMVTGPSGRRVILDPRSRLSPALLRSLEEGWGFHVVRGEGASAEVQLEDILPHMGFHELSSGERTAAIGRSLQLLFHPRWVVVPRPKDLWEGQIHLIFSQGATLNPALVALAVRAGFAVHLLGAPVPGDSGAAQVRAVPVLAAAGLDEAASKLLDKLRIPNQVQAKVDCDLGGGIHYQLRPELTFSYAGLSYAVVPREPPRAEDILAKAGYLPFSWQGTASVVDRLGDLLALTGRHPEHKAVTEPAGAEIALRVKGLLVRDKVLASGLYPSLSLPDGKSPQVLLTDANLAPQAAAIFLREGILPWIVRVR